MPSSSDAICVVSANCLATSWSIEGPASRGNACVAAAPRNRERRVVAWRVIIMRRVASSLGWLSHGKRYALHDPHDDRVHAVIVGARDRSDFPHRGHVIGLKPAPQSID